MRFRLAALVLGSAFLLCAQETVDSTLARMDRASANFRAMTAGIRQVSHTAVINEDNTSTGTIFLKRTKPREMKMLVDLKEPDPKTVALQGRKLDIFYPKMNTVQEFDVGKSRELLDQFFLVGFGTSSKELQNAYTIQFLGTETVAGQKSGKLELTPKSKEVLSHLRKFELWISDQTGYPVQQKFYMPGGDFMLVTYSGLKALPDLPDSSLKLKLPKDVKVEHPQK